MQKPNPTQPRRMLEQLELALIILGIVNELIELFQQVTSIYFDKQRCERVC